MLHPLLELAPSTLRSLAAALRTGSVTREGLDIALAKHLGGAAAADAAPPLRSLFEVGMSTAHVAILIDAVLDTRTQAASTASGVELILSGPDVPGIPVGSTSATIRRLLDEANHEVLIAGYALHNVQDLFGRLAKRLESGNGFRVVLCLDIARTKNDTTLSAEIVRRFARTFRERHWPWEALPEIYYDPRALATEPGKHASLHAKCIVTDRSRALVTSANLTDAAQHRNIEAGVLLSDPLLVGRLASYFFGLISANVLEDARPQRSP